MYRYVHCYMARNIHNVNDLVERGSEESNGAKDDSQVSGLDNRVAGSSIYWEQENRGREVWERSWAQDWTCLA